MKVKELIKSLRRMDQEAEVYIRQFPKQDVETFLQTQRNGKPMAIREKQRPYLDQPLTFVACNYAGETDF